jgi:hypothetical protein
VVLMASLLVDPDGFDWSKVMLVHITIAVTEHVSVTWTKSWKHCHCSISWLCGELLGLVSLKLDQV